MAMEVASPLVRHGKAPACNWLGTSGGLVASVSP
nr:MAG TPA: hypothetical protein [Caudoviricetes sp.]